MRLHNYRRRSNAGPSRGEVDRIKPIAPKERKARYEILGRSTKTDIENTVDAVSGVRGAISTLLVNFPSSFLKSPEYVEVMTGIIAAMSPKTEFIICADFGLDSNISRIERITDAAAISADRIRRVDIQNLDVTPFVQDICVCQTDGGGQTVGRFVFLEPAEFMRRDDPEICDLVGTALNHKVRLSDLLFQGGNMIVSDRHILIGYDHYVANQAPAQPDDPPLTTPAVLMAFQMSVDAQRDLVALGGAPVSVPAPIIRNRAIRRHVHYIHQEALGLAQPLFHIDMFVTPLGEIDGKPTVVIGEPEPTGQHGHPIDLLSHLSFHEVVVQLKTKGYEVKRIPITTGTQGFAPAVLKVREIPQTNETGRILRQSLLKDGAKLSEMVDFFEHHVLTWNNVIVENRGAEGLHIVMPSYDHPLDAKCRAVYESLGASLTVLPDTTMLAALRGAAHCLIRDVARTPIETKSTS